jgi:hypothetical protein
MADKLGNDKRTPTIFIATAIYSKNNCVNQFLPHLEDNVSKYSISPFIVVQMQYN